MVFCDWFAGCMLGLLCLGVWFRDCLLTWWWFLGLMVILFRLYCVVAVSLMCFCGDVGWVGIVIVLVLLVALFDCGFVNSIDYYNSLL